MDPRALTCRPNPMDMIVLVQGSRHQSSDDGAIVSVRSAGAGVLGAAIATEGAASEEASRPHQGWLDA
jgi:hypothetical protein